MEWNHHELPYTDQLELSPRLQFLFYFIFSLSPSPFPLSLSLLERHLISSSLVLQYITSYRIPTGEYQNT